MSVNLHITTEEQLEDALSAPYQEDVDLAGRLDNDVLVLGAGGKMGPTLVKRIARAFREARSTHTVIAVSRFSEDAGIRDIEDSGAVAIRADLMDDESLSRLPDCPNVIYLVGMKFGSSGRRPLTWAVNAYLPGRVATRFRRSRIVALSTGNVYPRVSTDSIGCTEDVEPEPVGEYAQSCLGRERIFQHFSHQDETPVCLIRLNYAVEARYGVFVDIATKVLNGMPISLEMGYVNTIWQGDANSVCFRALELCEAPARILNLTGPEVLSVRDIAERFGQRFDRSPHFEGTERPAAFLNDASRCHTLLGKPHVSPDEVIDLVAVWLRKGGATLGKPTKFEVHDGRF